MTKQLEFIYSVERISCYSWLETQEQVETFLNWQLDDGSPRVKYINNMVWLERKETEDSFPVFTCYITFQELFNAKS